ncbi:hypothetical protein JCM17845_00310 [Iodidimonas gelatinilytica]|uniref:Tail tape measure protein n=1 Tax=Iodidimonas gelatinilytica TaxID=1236966 RepID=A0A5A7MTX7_9PROT|nr:tail tape measure protein [Iodidimonas gelatinilytica]GEQ99407.1 hypothetical protein JCM17845_00310 [Iodidimonas gelatinilytica]
MTVELDALVVSLRADSRRFRSDMAQAQAALDDFEAMAALPQDALDQSLTGAAELGQAIGQSARGTFSELESALQRFTQSGEFSFDSLKSVAVSALGDIASAALDAFFPQFGGLGGGGIFSKALGGLLGLPGRATGGPVAPGQPYIVGEQGPEVFVPRGAGQIQPNRPGISGGSDRPISITINVSGENGLGDGRQSATQIALSVRRALAQAQRFD